MGLFKLLVPFFCIIISVYSEAQTGKPRITFESLGYHFGQINQVDSSIVITFNFSNVGEEPLEITRIVAPGFTVAGYSREKILPGNSGGLRFQFLPFNKVGNVVKTIRVFSNAENSPSELTVKGEILKESSVNKSGHNIGGLVIKQSQINFGYLLDSMEVVRNVPVWNSSKNTVRIKVRDVPPYLKINPKFNQLAPGEEGAIEVIYNSGKLNDWDFVLDRVKLEVIGSKSVVGQISVAANIREDFSKLSEFDKQQKPSISIPVKVFNFDTIASGDVPFYKFLVLNSGERDLVIRAVKPTCGCTAAMPLKNIVPPGDSTYIEVAFQSKGIVGYNKKGVTLISNDPENYKEFLWVTGFILPGRKE